MMKLSYDVISALKGRTLVTAESCTGGGIGAALTAVSGSSVVYKGGIISYTNQVKQDMLGVDPGVLLKYGAVSEQVANEMAVGVRLRLGADIGISVTGLAGPGGDEFGNPVGTVYIGYADEKGSKVFSYCFTGDRQTVRKCAVRTALEIILSEIK